MLDYHIIAEIKRREQERNEDRRPFLELPLPLPIHNETQEEKTEAKRVIIIDTVDEDPEDTLTTIDL